MVGSGPDPKLVVVIALRTQRVPPGGPEAHAAIIATVAANEHDAMSEPARLGMKRRPIREKAGSAKSGPSLSASPRELPTFGVVSEAGARPGRVSGLSTYVAKNSSQRYAMFICAAVVPGTDKRQTEASLLFR